MITIPSQTPEEFRALQDKIDRHAAVGRRYSPSHDEWRNAPEFQRREMTWPRSIIAAIRREVP